MCGSGGEMTEMTDKHDDIRENQSHSPAVAAQCYNVSRAEKVVIPSPDSAH